MEFASNKIIKQIKSLSMKKNRDHSGLFIIEGAKVVEEIPGFVDIVEYLHTDSFEKKNRDFNFRVGVRRYTVSEEKFNVIADTVSPQGIIAICRKMEYNFEKEIDRRRGILLVLDEIKDPGNLGTIVRTADASGVMAIVTTKNSVDIYNPKVLRSTMGSIFNVPVIQVPTLEYAVNALRKRNFMIIGTSPKGNRLYFEENFNKATAIIIGSEASGISNDGEMLCDRMVRIPIEGMAESLNAGVAASILMYESLRQRMIVSMDEQILE